MTTVTGSLRLITGGPFDTAKISFTPSTRLNADTTTILPLPVTVESEDGEFSIDLPSTDDLGYVPDGWHYKVNVVAGDYRRDFSMLLPDTESPVDLFEIPEATPHPVYGYVRTVNGQYPDAEGDVVVEGGGSGGTGIPGPQGPKGDTGPRGLQGLTGSTGPKGDQGPAGTPGAKGDTGDQGPAGTDGATGPKGDQGDPGADGPQGPKGDTGDTGATGSPGTTTWAGITDKPTFATVATSGSYADLTSKPTIPGVTMFAQFAVWTGSAWPARPSAAQPVIWIGGATSPTGATANDVWIPAS